VNIFLESGFAIRTLLPGGDDPVLRKTKDGGATAGCSKRPFYFDTYWSVLAEHNVRTWKARSAANMMLPYLARISNRIQLERIARTRAHSLEESTIRRTERAQTRIRRNRNRSCPAEQLKPSEKYLLKAVWKIARLRRKSLETTQFQ
jgi:hypothetical protein